MNKPERSYRLLFWILALVGLAADQGSKYGVFAWLADLEGRPHVFFQTPKGGFQFVAQPERNHDGQIMKDADGRPVPHVNRGALFGFLRDYETRANLAFAGISLLAAVVIVVWTARSATAHDSWLCAALGLILGGTLGNFYDRVTFGGVRDFIHWFYLFDWPVFNVADCCLVCGAGLLLIQAFLGQSVLGTTSAPATPAGVPEANRVCP